MSEASGDSNGREIARKAELEAKIRKRVACEERAFRIVEKLLDNTVTPEYLADCGLYITPSHYADIVEERAIINSCGYPVCSKALGAVPQQKYFISTKSNRVYDVTERKNFCSNKCFKASKYFEKQISTTPVWLREEEKPAELKVLDPDQNLGSPGLEVVGAGVKSGLLKELSVLEKLDSSEDLPDKKWLHSTHEPEADGLTSAQLSWCPSAETTTTGHVTSKKRTGVTNELLGVSEDSEGVKEGLAGNADSDSLTGNVDTFRGQGEVDALASSVAAKLKVNPWAENFDQSKEAYSVENKAGDENSPKHNSGQGVGATVTSSKTDYLMQLLNKRKKLLSSMIDDQPIQSMGPKTLSTGSGNKTHPAKSEDSLEIKEKNVTLMRNVCSDGKIRDSAKIQTGNDFSVNITESPECEKDFQKQLPSMHLELVKICCRVSEWVSDETLKYLGFGHPQETKDDLERKAKIERASEETNPSETLLGMRPESHKNNEGEQLENKLSRNPSVSERLSERDTVFTQKVLQFYKGSSKHIATSEDKEDSPVEPILPPVDSIAQMRIRRKIVLEKLERSMPEMLSPLGLLIQHISSELRELVSTFSLNSTNITFKPGEWTLVALFLVKMLSQKVAQIQKSFKDGRSLHFYHVFLTSLGCSLDDLDKILHIILKTKTKNSEENVQVHT